MRNTRILALIICLVVSHGLGCVNKSPARSEGGDLVSLGFLALKTNDVSLVQPLAMTEKRYQQLFKQIRTTSVGEPEGEPGDAEIKSLASEAKEILDGSFGLIQDLLGQLNFDFGKAKLKAVLVMKQRDSREFETKWVNYLPSDPRVRLDINYLIESEGNVAVIKLNDVFRVGNQRYLARGYRFQAYKPTDTADESVMKLVVLHHLNGWVPVVEKKP